MTFRVESGHVHFSAALKALTLVRGSRESLAGGFTWSAGVPTTRSSVTVQGALWYHSKSRSGCPGPSQPGPRTPPKTKVRRCWDLSSWNRSKASKALALWFLVSRFPFLFVILLSLYKRYLKIS